MAGVVAEDGRRRGQGEAVDEPHVPWHFKLLVLATAVYLAWRAVQGLVWLVGRF